MAGEESIFTRGRLEMSATPLPESGDLAAWGDLLPNRIAVILSVILVLASIKDFIRLAPTLFYALDRVRGSLSIEFNLSMARMRNSVAIAFFLPFCLTLDRYSAFRPFPGWDIPRECGFVVIAAVLLVYLALRRLCNMAIRIPKLGQESRSAEFRALFNYFIALCTLIVPLAGIMSAFGFSDNVIRLIILVSTGLAYSLFIIRAGEIFLKTGRSALSTILYLCALEILPAALVVASAAIL